MWFSTFVLKNVFRRKVRSALTGVGVAVAVGAVVALVGLSEGFERSFAELYEVRGLDIVVLQAKKMERLMSSLDEKLGTRFQELPNVDKVSYALVDMVSFEKANLIGVPLAGWSPDSLMFDALKITSGRRLREGDKRAVMLGFILARNLGKGVDEVVELEGAEFTIVGIYESFNVYENGSAVVLLRELQQLMQRENHVTGFMLAVANVPNKSAVVEDLCKQIDAMKDDKGRPLGLSAMPTRDYTNTTLQIRMARVMAWLTSTIALIIGAVGMLNTMVMSVFERTKEIGILRAIGWRKSRVVLMIMLEALTLSVAGAVLGSVFAYVLTNLLSSLPFASGFVKGNITLETVAMGFAIAVLLGMLGGAYPAVRGARLLPTEALRHE